MGLPKEYPGLPPLASPPAGPPRCGAGMFLIRASPPFFMRDLTGPRDGTVKKARSEKSGRAVGFNRLERQSPDKKGLSQCLAQGGSPDQSVTAGATEVGLSPNARKSGCTEENVRHGCPLYPQERTFSEGPHMSALCQKRTLAATYTNARRGCQISSSGKL